MAHGDIKDSKNAGKRTADQFDNARLFEELLSEQDSNIEVGDFLSDLASAVRFRMKSGLGAGDWIDDPSRFLTDGKIFAQEEAVASEVKLQVTLSLDTSNSMWINRLMKHAGPAVLAFDRTIRKAMQDMPQGSIHYAPFIFHETAHKVPAAFLNSYTGKVMKANEQEGTAIVWPTYPRMDQVSAGILAGELPSKETGREFKLSGSETRIAPLFQAIKDWEEKEGDTSATRLDIVLTDGVLEEDGDVEKASLIQESRNGRLRSVMLNFLSVDQWSNYQIPERCGQFAVTADSINTSLRGILNEAIADLFA